MGHFVLPVVRIVSARLTMAIVPSLSTEVTAPGDGVGSTHASMVASLGTPDKTGAVVSTIVRVCDCEAELPQESMAVHVRTILRSLAQFPPFELLSLYVDAIAVPSLSNAVTSGADGMAS